MFENMLKYILMPWEETSTDIVLTTLCITMITCLAVGLYFGFTNEKKEKKSKYLNFYTPMAILSYLAVYTAFYWYVAITFIVIETIIIKIVLRDEGKEHYYAAMHGMTHKELLDLWYESEDKYEETMREIENMDVDKKALRQYGLSNKVIILGFTAATVIFLFLLAFPGGYKLFP